MPPRLSRPPDHDEILGHLILTREGARPRALGRQVASGALVRIRPGCHLDADFLMSQPASWQRAEVIMVARILASSRAWSDSVAIGSSAALLHGLPRVWSYPDVHLEIPRATGHGQRPRVLPAVEVAGRLIAPPCRVHLHHAGHVRHMLAVDVRGTRVLAMEDAVLSTLLLDASEAGFVTACEGLRRMSGFTRRALDRSRLREARARQRLCDRLDALPARTRNRERARRLLERADAACDSVAEERLLFLLQSAGVQGLRTQHLVAHPTGKFYLDIGIPGLLLDIEFDGTAKYGNNPEIEQMVLDEQHQRAEALEAMGWVIVRFRWRELSDPAAVLHKIRAALRERGADLTIDPARALLAGV